MQWDRFGAAPRPTGWAPIGRHMHDPSGFTASGARPTQCAVPPGSGASSRVQFAISTEFVSARGLR